MNIHVYTIGWNEEVLIPHFLRHYETFCSKIIVCDNESTDRTPELVRAHPKAELVTWESGGSYDSIDALEKKNNDWKESRGEADWVIVVDVDEFLYHPLLVEVLSRYRDMGVNIPQVQGYSMVSDTIPTADRPLYEICRMGVEDFWYSKHCIFNPEIDMEYIAGCHSHTDQAKALIDGVEAGQVSDDRILKLLHYRFLGGTERLVPRFAALARRQSKRVRELKMGIHYSYSPEKLEAWIRETKDQACDVVTG